MNEKDFKVGCYTPSAEGKNNLQNRKKRIIFTTTVAVLALVVLLVVAGLVYYKSKIGLLQYMTAQYRSRVKSPKPMKK